MNSLCAVDLNIGPRALIRVLDGPIYRPVLIANADLHIQLRGFPKQRWKHFIHLLQHGTCHERRLRGLVVIACSCTIAIAVNSTG